MPAASLRKSQPATRSKATAEPRLSRTRRPEALPVADWQAALRRQFGREQPFGLRNLGREPVFSTFRVDNPDSGTQYLVTVRGLEPGSNHCTCWDFATNHLGTCKHIEFTLARLQSRRGGKAALARGHEAPYSEIRLDYLGQRRLRLHPGTTCPPAPLKKARQGFDPANGWALPWERLEDVSSLARAAQAARHELRIGDDAWAFIAQVRDAEQRRHTLAQVYPKGANDKALHKLLKTRLYPYQAEGALFAARAGRALLGDEMGLGKTVQAIAAAELMARHFGVSKVLVVCSTSLKHQWKAEFARFAVRPAQVIHGLRPQRQAQHAEDTFVRIVNYEMLARDADLIDAWALELVIADEAQRRLQCALQNMRMACNSTFLLDHETDHGSKADELLTLLDEWLESPEAKVVVFSQWLGTHELIRRRLADRRGATCCSTAACRANSAARWSSASMPTPIAASSSAPTPAASA
jgi:hypothetical protein